ncbi:MAG TPA: oxidoreductase [Acidimicrobiales bacterium]|jgi:NAD(P)-dependent dehydrogenase (short-subunit alcohol dehydrogenase family)|nr:oxidoreductase [Acidimicrobiales bacterium]
MKRISGSEATGSDNWTAAGVGDLTGRVALVTGANSGIGYEVTRVLADHGAHVLMACRNQEKAARARDKLESQVRRTSLELVDLDLSDLASVRDAAGRVVDQHARLDLLVNNAGVMGTPYRQTADGFELQMATNHLGHFALTGLLLDRLVTTERSRVVTVSSHMHRLGRVRTDDVAAAAATARNPWILYGTSKLANLLFVAELSRRLESGGFGTLALAAHPGWTRSNLAGSGGALSHSRVRRRLSRLAGSNLGQSAAGGALPVLCAATASHLSNGQYIGPAGAFGMYGPPRIARPSRRARDLTAAARLWAASEELTGVHYSVGAAV